MFRGANALSLDAKGRITVPARYRELLQNTCQGRLVLTADPSRCLLVYPQPTWEIIERQLADLPNLVRENRGLQRLLIGHACDCDMDGHGRILLPPSLREYARLDKRVMLVGQVNKLELWDERAWNEHCERLLDGGEDQAKLSESLSSLSISL